MSRATISGPVRLSRVLIGYCDRVRRISSIGRVEIDRTTSPPSVGCVDLGQEARRVGLELLEEDAVGGDLAEDLAVGRARDADADRQAGAVARQADHAHVVAEILAAELRADAEAAGQLEHLLLEIAVAIGLAVVVALASAACRDSGSSRASPSSNSSRPRCRRSRSPGDRAGRPRCRGCGSSRRGISAAISGSAPPSSADRESSCWPSRRPWRRTGICTRRRARHRGRSAPAGCRRY